MLRILTIIIISIVSSSFSYAGDNIDSFFSDGKELEYVKIIKDDLNNYSDLTQNIRDNKKFKQLISENYDNIVNIQDKENIQIILSGRDIKSLGNIGWEYQNIGVTNKILFLERYVNYKNYQIKNLELKLAKSNKSTDQEIAILQQQVDKMKILIQSYLDESMWSD